MEVVIEFGWTFVASTKLCYLEFGKSLVGVSPTKSVVSTDVNDLGFFKGF